jgi:DNA modification methylase
MSARTIHPFPARMAPEIALNAIPARKRKQLTVLDPMCGSGTVLNVALTRGHRAIGIDIDPLAVMMSRVSVGPIDTKELLQAGARVVTLSRKAGGTAPWGDDHETDAFVDYWFGEKQRRDLIDLASTIQTYTHHEIRMALQVAISRIIVTKSPQASLAADTSHSRPHRVRDTSDYDVFAGFEKSLSQMAQKLDQRSTTGTARVLLGDARVLGEVEDSSVDMAVTSPPYLNALDYLRGHKLALVWFGYTISELRARRSISIGSERNLGSQASKVVEAMVETVEAEAIDKTLLKRGMVERFAQDCLSFASELFRVTKCGGCAVLVVGNSTLRGNYIRNDVITQAAMQHAGFTPDHRYEREIPPTKRYMAIDSGAVSSITKRMRTEVVLTMRH